MWRMLTLIFSAGKSDWDYEALLTPEEHSNDLFLLAVCEKMWSITCVVQQARMGCFCFCTYLPVYPQAFDEWVCMSSSPLPSL